MPPSTGSISRTSRWAIWSVSSRVTPSPRRFCDSLARPSRSASTFGGDLVLLLGVELGDPLQHLREPGPAVARLRREVGAAPEGLAGRGQEHGQRPAALLAQQRQRRLVDAVEVGALLPVDLDVDEEPVHQRRDLRVLEALVRHDVAPVAGRVADREQDRLVLLLGPRQGLVPPGVPGDRVVAVLQEIGTGLAGESVLRGVDDLGHGGGVFLVWSGPAAAARRAGPCRALGRCFAAGRAASVSGPYMRL